MGYYAQLNALTHFSALKQNAYHYLAAGYGTFGYEPNVDYIFGIPVAITPGGAVMNIPMLNIFGSDENQKKQASFNLNIGLLSSALEHAIPEQFLNTDPENPIEAISAVKALSKAGTSWQKIYHITRANQATILPNIHHYQSTMDEISNALAAGKEVITHTDAIAVPGWNGAGYIIFDPITGDGAFKIDGGKNGAGIYEALTATSFSLGTMSATADGLSAKYAKENLPLKEDLAKVNFAKKLSLAGKFLGGTALVMDIITSITDYFFGNASFLTTIGKISVALFGFGVGALAGAAIATAFTPLAAGVIAAAFVATLTIVLLDFNEIYFSYNLMSRSRRLFT